MKKGSPEDRAQARAESKILGLDFNTGQPIIKQEKCTSQNPCDQCRRLENGVDYPR
jgi:hypothetical protein